MHGENNTKNRAAIALALCFCVLVLTSFLAVKSTLDKIKDSGTAVTDNETAVTESSSPVSETPVVDSQDNSKQETAPQRVAYIMPVEGTVQKNYAMDSLVYSKTLDQYMTHPGVDIHAALSAEVYAVADGTVTKVYNDDRYGITVCITHDDGIVSRYSNLSEHGLAETGDEIKQGQKIGNIGETSLFESLEEAHLHFEMTKDGNCTDPADFIKQLQ